MILSRFSEITAISFKESEKFFKNAKKVVLTGNPIRKEMLEIQRADARESLKIDRSNPLVVIFGGSLGDEKINQSVVDMLKNHYEEGSFKIIYATGEKQYKNVVEKLDGVKYKSVEVLLTY